MVPGSSITLKIEALGSNTSATLQAKLVSLPAGFSSTTTFPLTVPPQGATFVLQVASNVAAGDYTLSVEGWTATLSATTTVPIHVDPTIPMFYFGRGLFNEIHVPIEGTASYEVSAHSNSAAIFDVDLSIRGLPPGVSATFDPNPIRPGQTGTLSLTASPNAPFVQNQEIFLIGTPEAPVAESSLWVLLDVTPKPGSLPGNRTDYRSTEGTPYAATYDRDHKLIFSSNNSWNRIEVISSDTHAVVKTISIRDPRGIDVAPDNSRVWVATGSQQVFEIDTSTFATRRHLLPKIHAPGITPLQPWEGWQLYALSDGTVLLYCETPGVATYLTIWDPNANALTPVPLPSGPYGPVGPGLIVRSGDGRRFYSLSGTSSGISFYYDVPSRSSSAAIQMGGYVFAAAANQDASRVAVYDFNGLIMYDGDLNPIGPLPGGGLLSSWMFEGGLVFSPYNGNLYEVCMPIATPVIWTVDSNTLTTIGIAPAMPFIPVGNRLDPPFYMPMPFAVDDTGMVLGVEYYGIAFDDSMFYQNFVTTLPGTPIFLQHMSPYSGPLGGGTVSGGFGNAFNVLPDVWYGPNRGSAHLDIFNILTITSPASSVPGPVHVKMIFPNGIEVFDPLFFSYGPFIQYSFFSGGAPGGGAPGVIAGYGFPIDDTGGTLSVGGAPAVITTKQTQYLPFTRAPFPSTYLKFDVPPGSPGWADLTLSTPDGTSTLPKSFFYAKSVQDYPSSDSFQAVIFDPNREQLYLSAGDHIDVFSLTYNQFLNPIQPPANGGTKQFAGLALTPDGQTLLAADLLDGSLAVIPLDDPASSWAIAVAPVDYSDPRCTIGPLDVAPLVNNQVLVALGGLPGTGCGPYGPLYMVDLVAGTAVPPISFNGGYVSASHDGTLAAISGSGFYIYDAVQQSVKQVSTYQLGAAISGDGNVAASQWMFTDGQANLLGRVARPEIYYPNLPNYAVPEIILRRKPQLNSAGSLYFLACPNMLDIVDVQHGLLRMRFSLTQTILDVAAPMAIDSNGRRVFLMTDKGLTIVDLGEALLSVGALNPSTASTGAQVTMRGSGFNPSTTVRVGGVNANVSYVDEATLTITIPPGLFGIVDLVLTNADGKTYRFDNALTIQ